MKRVMVMAAAAMLALVVTPVLASFCGCSSAPLTTMTLAQARSLAPLQARSPGVQAAEQAVDVLLVEFSYQFNQDYAAMDTAAKADHYRLMVELSARRAAAVEAVARAYARVGAPRAVQDVLLAHAGTFRQPTAERVGYIAELPRLKARAEGVRDRVLADGLKLLADSCDKVADGDLAVCTRRALASSTPDSGEHFAAYATMAGPAAMLAGRLKALDRGAAVLPPRTDTAALN